MLPSSILLLAGALGLASATPSYGYSKRAATPATPALAAAKQKVLIAGGLTGTISTAEFDGTSFKMLSNWTDPVMPVGFSWAAFKEPNIVYVTNENNEFHGEIVVLNVDTTTGKLSHVKNITHPSHGVVHFEFNKDKTLMVGSAYGNGTVDVFALAKDGTPTFKNTIKFPTDSPLDPKDPVSRPHQAVLDQSGKFFFVNDLGQDAVVVLGASANGTLGIVNRVNVEKGCGPRHSVFWPPTGAASHYLVLCEKSNAILVHSVDFKASPPTIKQTGKYNSISPALPASPKPPVGGPAAGEIAVSNDGKHVYVSNRLTQSDDDHTATDSIVHFAAALSTNGSLALSLKEAVSSGGKFPRHFSLGADAKQEVLFAGNVINGTALLAFARAPDTGVLTPINSSAVAFKTLAGTTVQGGPPLVIPLSSGNSTTGGGKCKGKNKN